MALDSSSPPAAEVMKEPLLKSSGLANKVSFLRLPGAVITIAVHAIDPMSGAITFAIFVATDALDGQIARRLPGEETVEGTKVDPAMDKVLIIPTTGYLMYCHSTNVYLLLGGAISVGIDIVSQILRDPINKLVADIRRAVFRPQECTPVTPENATSVKSSKAVWPGKIKMGLQSLAAGILLAFGENESVQNVGAGMLGAAAISGAVGIVQRNRKEKIAAITTDSAQSESQSTH